MCLFPYLGVMCSLLLFSCCYFSLVRYKNSSLFAIENRMMYNEVCIIGMLSFYFYFDLEYIMLYYLLFTSKFSLN